MKMAQDISPMINIVNKLQSLKVVVKKWDRRKKTQLKKELNDILEEMEKLRPQLLLHNPPMTLKEDIHTLELKRKQILQIRKLHGA